MARLMILLSVVVSAWIPGYAQTLPARLNAIPPVVQSLIIPGWGEQALQHSTRGRYFLYTELTLVSGAVGVLLLSGYETKNFMAFAAHNAGVTSASKNEQFWIDIGNYDSLDEHNAEHLRWRENMALYPRGSHWDWQWNSAHKRRQFRQMRIQRDRLILTGKFLVGSIVLNHIISGIDVLYLQRKSQSDLSLHISRPADGRGSLLNISLSW